MKDIRIAWLLPTAWFYWQPSICELKKFLPETKIFTGLFSGYAKGFEQAIDVDVVGDRKIIAVTESSTSYGDNFTYLSPKIVFKLLSYKPDVVFSSSFGVWSILALLFKFIGRWKVVIAYEGSSPGVDYRNSFLRLTIRRIMVWLADACITNSYAGKEYLIHYLRASEPDVFVQPYEVPDVRSLAEINTALTTVGKTKDLKFTDLQQPVFIFVGSIVARKGVKDLLEACRILKERNLTRYSLLIVGDGEQSKELQDFTQQHGLESSVIWVGRVDYSDIGTYFHHADAFVLPTLEDTWGMVILEAMLLGKPVIASTGAGASELVIDGENGYRFPPSAPDQLADVMGKLITDPESVNRMGQNSKQRMEQYSPQAAAQFMAEIVNLVTGS